MANHYSVLGVSPDATYQQIKAAYTKLVLQAHPDKGGSQSVFIQIQAAWEVLRNPDTRAKYDEECRNPGSENAQKAKHRGRDQTASGAQFPRDYSYSYSYRDSYYDDSMPGGHYSYSGSGYRTGPNFNSWNGYRDSTAGSAYNSYYGSSASGEDYDDTRPRTSSTPNQEDSSHHHHRNARENHRDSYSQSRRRDSTASPPRRSRSSSPPPTTPAELDLRTVKGLAEQASRNHVRYKELIDMLRSSTKSHPLSPEIEIKLEHVHLFLQNRELKLNHRVVEIKMHHLNQQTKTPSEKMEPFFVSLWDTIVKEDKETVSDVSLSMSRVSADTSQWLRRRNVLEARGLEVTDDDIATQDLKASTKALERLLAKVLLSAPGVAPQRSY